MAAILDEDTQFLDSSGAPLVGGFIFIGDQNADPVLNPKSIFSDRELATPLANPQTIDANGRSANKIWTDGRYSIEVQDLNSVQIYSELDNGEGTESGITTLDNVLGANAITADGSPAVTAYVDKEQYVFITAQVNTTGVTLDIDSVGVRSVLKNHDEAIADGEFEANQAVIVVFNETDDVFEWTNQNLKLFPHSLGINFIGGGITSTGTDTDHDIDITVAECRDVDNTFNMSIPATTIAIDAAAGINSISTGTVAADTPYGIWAWEDSTGVASPVSGYTFDVVTDSLGSPTAPTGYDKKRLIGFRLTDSSSNIIAMIQSGDYFRYTGDVILDVSDNTITNLVFKVGTLSVPPSSLAHIYGATSTTSADKDDGKLFIKTNGAADVASGLLEAFAQRTTTAGFTDATNIGDVLVDSSSQIQYAAAEASGTTTVSISTLGFTMLTRREP